jgi:hypothetical protein
LVCPESAVKKDLEKVFSRRQQPDIIDGLKRNGSMPNILMKVSKKHGW